MDGVPPHAEGAKRVVAGSLVSPAKLHRGTRQQRRPNGRMMEDADELLCEVICAGACCLVLIVQILQHCATTPSLTMHAISWVCYSRVVLRIQRWMSLEKACMQLYYVAIVLHLSCSLATLPSRPMINDTATTTAR